MEDAVAAVHGLESDVVVVRFPETVLAVVVPQEWQVVFANVHSGVVTEGRIDGQMECDNAVAAMNSGQRVNDHVLIPI